jgi:hypothetical protein
MWLDHVGPFSFYNWFKDDWLVSRQAVKLFLLAALLDLGTIPIFLGKIDPAKLPFWQRLPLGIEGILAPISIFFLWIGMGRYWIKLDNSTKLAKVVSFILLLFGMFYGTVLYYFFVYRPQVVSGFWAKPAPFSGEEKNRSPGWRLQKTFFISFISLFGFMLVFGLLLTLLLAKILPQYVHAYEEFLRLVIFVGIISLLLYLIIGVFRLGMKTRR